MNRSHPIVLGVAKTALPADAVATAELRRAGAHWRRWRRSGAAISAGVHGLLAILLVAGMPQFGAEAKKEIAKEKPPVEVEIVTRPPETPPEKPEPKPPEKALEKPEPEKPKAETPPEIPQPPKAAIEPEKPAAPAAKATPQPPAPAAPPPAAAAPPAAPPPATAPGPEAAPRALPETQWAMPQLPPAGSPPPALAAPRSAPPPGGDERGPDGELVSEPNVIALPDEKKDEKKKKVDRWVLDPLVVDLREKCGVARISAVIEITEALANGNLRGTLRNTTRWAKCPPTDSIYQVELQISGNEVRMVTAGGIADRGVMKGGLMLLEDAYGRSVWRKR